ncbi:ABC transporter ATP-binding protein [Alphaproteobacteria bacterium]|nr:ABC transporter ATP-binding protein [Alphaproteobacteria bacterium]
MNDILVKVQNMSKSFGGLKAIDNCSIEIKRNSITGIIGPNGSGKSTLFNLITGNLKPDEGRIFYNGSDITNQEPFELFKLGILRTFQIAHEFSNLTVIENLMMVPGNQFGENLITSIFLRDNFKKQENEIKEKAFEVLKFLKIDHLINEKAGNLSGGQKKLLELARTMMVDAKIVFLDEVGAGVNKSLLKEISDSILKLHEERKYTFCIIEHDIDFITKLCDPVIVLAEGKVLFEGTAREVKENNEVINSYLGKNY